MPCMHAAQGPRLPSLVLCCISPLLLREGDIIATLAWNTTRHMETWYGIMGNGAICHTLNPRLSDKDIAYIVNDAQVKGPWEYCVFIARNSHSTWRWLRD